MGGFKLRLPKSLEGALGQASNVLDAVNGLRSAARRASDDLATARPVLTITEEGVELNLDGDAPVIRAREKQPRALRKGKVASLGDGPDPAAKRKAPRKRKKRTRRTP